MSKPPANAVESARGRQAVDVESAASEGRREIDELHLPLGQPVKLIMTSQDVIHSYFISGLPHEAGRAAGPLHRSSGSRRPRRATTTSSAPSTAGRITPGWSARSIVLEPADYARWLAEQQPRGIASWQRARAFSPQRGCSGCHGRMRAVRAPLLERDLSASPCRSRPGRVVIADEQYLHDSILLPQQGHRRRLRADHADVSGPAERGGSHAADRVYQVADRRERNRPMTLSPHPQAAPQPDSDRAELPRRSGHDACARGCSRRTTSGSRILYMISITLFFLDRRRGGDADAARADDARRATWSPRRPTTSSSRIHGVIMVWFFLIPSIPTVLGNFLVPLMIGARDLAFPRLNLASWYLFMVGGAVHALGDDRRRRGHRLDVLHAVQHALLEQARHR